MATKRQTIHERWKRGTLIGCAVIVRGVKRVVVDQDDVIGKAQVNRPAGGYLTFHLSDLRWPKASA